MKPYTNQTAFDVAAPALLAQNKPSITESDDACAYRGDGGLKCAIGHLIPDELYRENMECIAVGAVVKRHPELTELLGGCDALFLGELQDIHDNFDPDQWREQLLALAATWDLKTDSIDNN